MSERRLRWTFNAYVIHRLRFSAGWLDNDRLAALSVGYPIGCLDRAAHVEAIAQRMGQPGLSPSRGLEAHQRAGAAP